MAVDSENRGYYERLTNYDLIYHDVKNISVVFKNIGSLIENSSFETNDHGNTIKFWNEIKPYSSSFLQLIDLQTKAKNNIAINNLQNNAELFAIIDKQYKQLSLDPIDLKEFTSNTDPFYLALASYSQKMHEISKKYKLKNSNIFQKYLKKNISILYSKIQEIPFWQKYLEDDSVPEICNEPVNILNLTLDIVQDVKNTGANKKHPIKIIDHINQKDIILNTDKRFLRLIIENLIYNSCKYSHDNDDPIFIDCNPNHQINIIDKGIGFSAEEADIINKFKPNVRTEKAKEHTAGTGLGLAFAKKCADALGYKLTAKSDGIDQGSTFTVNFAR